MPRRLEPSTAAIAVAVPAVASAAVAAVAAVASAAAVAAPVGGASYRGNTVTRTPVSFRVAGDRRKLARYRFVATTRCTNGESGTVVFHSAPRAPVIAIRRGRFSARFRALAVIHDARTGRNVVGTYSDTVSGRFGSRRRARGSVRIRFRSRDGRLRCDSGALRYAVRAA